MFLLFERKRGLSRPIVYPRSIAAVFNGKPNKETIKHIMNLESGIGSQNDAAAETCDENVDKIGLDEGSKYFLE